jgi:hypothetical protein
MRQCPRGAILAWTLSSICLDFEPHTFDRPSTGQVQRHPGGLRLHRWRTTLSASTGYRRFSLLRGTQPTLPQNKKRDWFVAHSRGASFRSLDLPIVITRRMEHIFLASQDHLPIEHAMRRAELLALGASDEIVRAVMSTRLASDLRNGEFWRTVWMFLIANADDLDSAQIGPLIDYIQAVRHD